MSTSIQSLLKKKSTWLIVLALVGLATALYLKLNTDEYQNIHSETLAVDEKNTIDIFRADKPEKGLLIYIGTNSHHSRQFSNLSYYVAQIEPQLFLSKAQQTSDQQCLNIADRLANIASQLQKKFAIAAADLPILVGDSIGAAVVYTALAQSGRNTFHAGISLNFNTSMRSEIPLCAVHNFAIAGSESHTDIFPVKHLSTSWYIFQNSQAATDPDSNQFIANISNARLTASPTAKPDSIAEALQILQWLDPRLSDQTSSNNSNSDLPLIEVPAQSDAETPMAILLTGDGGWAEIDKKLAQLLAERGIPTVALDSLSYFWKARSPQETAKDIDDTISLYTATWQKKHVILIGYSFGADVLPFIANQLSPENKSKVALVALLGMGKTAAFEFRLASWMNADTSEHRLPLPPELEKMRWANSVCIYGLEDDSTACASSGEQGVKVISMKGDHHFDENYALLTQHILDNVKIPTPVESEPPTEEGLEPSAEEDSVAPEEIVEPTNQPENQVTPGENQESSVQEAENL